MSNIFIEAFASVFIEDVPNQPLITQNINLEMGEIPLSVAAVRETLMVLRSHSSMGPDNLHPMLLKNCATGLAYPMFIMFERSLYSGQLPEGWKTSIVVPIFKNKTRYNPLNYRPVSFTSVCCKTMERLLTSHIVG